MGYLGTILGAEKILNGGFEIWTFPPGEFDYWTASEFGSSSIAEELAIVHSGIRACEFNVDGSGSQVAMQQVPQGGYSVGNLYLLVFWAFGDGSNQIHISDDFQDLGGLVQTPIPPASWNEYNYYFTPNAQSDRILLSNTEMSAPSAETSWSFWLDDVSIKEVTLGDEPRLIIP